MPDWAPDIQRLQSFDDDEWEHVERHYCGRLLAYVSRRVRDREARDDILQETMLGAVRGIRNFDALYTFEQYLFGICHNRTIDHLRRQRARTLPGDEEQETPPVVEVLATDEATPSRIARGRDLGRRAKEILGSALKTWVQETWQQGEFVRLMVIEALFSGGWRNKDTWQRFDLRDETAVAGIKFRALKRLRTLVQEQDPQGEVLGYLAASDGEAEFDFDVSQTWRQQRVSCAARYWLGRMVVDSLPPGPADFLRFHVGEMDCPWCRANLEDLQRIEEDPELVPLLERVRASTLSYLRSRSLP